MSFFLYFVFVYLCISCAAIILRIKLSIIIIRARRRLRHTHGVSRRRQRISSSMKFPMSLETATIATITCPLPLSSPHDTTRNQCNAAGSLSMHTGCDRKLIFLHFYFLLFPCSHFPFLPILIHKFKSYSYGIPIGLLLPSPPYSITHSQTLTCKCKQSTTRKIVPQNWI